jgi:hypothetical protein
MVWRETLLERIYPRPNSNPTLSLHHRCLYASPARAACPQVWYTSTLCLTMFAIVRHRDQCDWFWYFLHGAKHLCLAPLVHEPGVQACCCLLHQGIVCTSMGRFCNLLPSQLVSTRVSSGHLVSTLLLLCVRYLARLRRA